MAFDFNKMQDAIVDFFGGILPRIAALFNRSGAAADEIRQTADAAEKSIQALTPEVKQALDALEKVGAVCDSLSATAVELQGAVADVRAFLADLREGRVKFVTETKVEKA